MVDNGSSLSSLEVARYTIDKGKPTKCKPNAELTNEGRKPRSEWEAEGCTDCGLFFVVKSYLSTKEEALVRVLVQTKSGLSKCLRYPVW